MKQMLIGVGLMLLAAGCCTNGDAPCQAACDDEFQHVVLFKYKEGTTPEQMAEAAARFAALPDKIDVIQGFQWGPDESIEGLQKGFHHCFIVTFDDPEGCKTYIDHEAHQEFVGFVSPMFADVFVFDFTPRP